MEYATTTVIKGIVQKITEKFCTQVPIWNEKHTTNKQTNHNKTEGHTHTNKYTHVKHYNIDKNTGSQVLGGVWNFKFSELNI